MALHLEMLGYILGLLKGFKYLRKTGDLIGEVYIFPGFLSCNVSCVTCPVAIESIISSFYALFLLLN